MLLLFFVIGVFSVQLNAQSYLNIVKTDNTKNFAALSSISKMTFSPDGTAMQLVLTSGSTASVATNTIQRVTFSAIGEGTVLSVPRFAANEKSYELSQNYPNPFNPSTMIKFSVAEKGLVTLKVYDALGSVVKTLVNEDKPSGQYSVQFDARSIASGVYFYVLRTGNFSMTKKMLLIK